MIKILNNFETDYRKEEVIVTYSFRFLSDTPLVKLLAILIRFGVKREDLPRFFDTIQIEYEKIKAEDKLIELLGCFAMDKNSFNHNRYIHYNERLYQMEFNIDKDKYYSLKSVTNILDKDLIQQYSFLDICIDEILEKALKYVN